LTPAAELVASNNLVIVDGSAVTVIRPRITLVSAQLAASKAAYGVDTAPEASTILINRTE
jgi:hypothetical protein